MLQKKKCVRSLHPNLSAWLPITWYRSDMERVAGTWYHVSDWYNPNLSPAGHKEAKRGRHAMQDADYEFDIYFTLVQKRVVQTLWTVLDAID